MMETTLTQLGTAGGALLVLWLFTQSMLKLQETERQRNETRLDKRDDAMRVLEADIRNKFAAQLQENTNAMLAHSQIMERVLTHLDKH